MQLVKNGVKSLKRELRIDRWQRSVTMTDRRLRTWSSGRQRAHGTQFQAPSKLGLRAFSSLDRPLLGLDIRASDTGKGLCGERCRAVALTCHIVICLVRFRIS